MRLIVAPGCKGRDDGSRGTTRETYFSPNRVFGTIAPVTLAGIACSWPGKMPSFTFAPAAVALKPSTWPTITPRIFTSARSGIWSPMVEASRVTSSKWVNRWVNTP